MTRWNRLRGLQQLERNKTNNVAPEIERSKNTFTFSRRKPPSQNGTS
jgi:hypothetical protein